MVDRLIHIARTPGMLTPALLALFPLWWALGLGEVVFAIFGVALAISLLQTRRITVPRFASAWIVFLFAVAASGVMLEEANDIFNWGLRLSQYISVGLLLPYVLTHRESTPARRVFASGSILFIGSVVGGYLGLIIGDVSYLSPFGMVLPGGIRANSFVHDIVNPSFADVERFLGTYEVTRPKAPFTYTNEWGASMGLLFPFALHDAFEGFGIRRNAARLALLASPVPIAFSLNQGLWISIVAGVGYATVRTAGRGDGRAVLQVLLAAFVAVAVIVATPLGEAFSSDLQNPDATSDRAELYESTIREVNKSPLIGYGAPRQVNDSGPPAGTHGQLWIVLFSHGAIGALSYFGFLGGLLWMTRRYRTRAGLWCHTILFISFVQAPFYGHVPQQLAIMMVAGALGLLDVRGLLGSKSQVEPAALRSLSDTMDLDLATQTPAT